MADKKIGLFFGSFNPVHNGHLMIANFMAEFGKLDQVWFVISPLNPFKAEQDLLPDYQRRELLTRAIGDYQKFRISSVEFQLPKPSYTIDTLEFLKNKYPDFEFSLIMGSDQLPDFHLWKNPDQILAGYKIFVYPRPAEDRDTKRVTREPETQGINDSAASASRLTPHDLSNHPSITFIEAPLMEISSSFIRQSIRNGKNVRFFMPELSWQYLEEMHFYE